MKTLIKTIKLILEAIVEGAEKSVKSIESSSAARKYLYGMASLATLAILLPAIIAIAGIVMGWQWLIGCAGLLSTLSFLILAVWVSPLGVLIESLLRILDFGPKEGIMGVVESFFKGEKVDLIRGERYVRIARGTILWFSITYWILNLVPIRNNPSWIPLYLLSTACVILMEYHWKMGSEWLKPTLYYSGIGIIILCTIRFAIPGELTLRSACDWVVKPDEKGNYNYMTSPLVVYGIILVLIGVVAAIIRSIRKKNAGGATVTSPHSGNASPWPAILIVAAIFGSLVALRVVIERPDLRDRLLGTGGQTAATSPASAELGQGPFVRVTPDTNSWTALTVGEGVWVHCAVDGPGHVLYRLKDKNGNQSDQEDWADRQQILPAMAGPYTMLFRSKNSSWVSVRVYMK